MSKRERSKLARRKLRRTFHLFSSLFPSSSSLQSENNSEIEADFKMHLPYPLLDSCNCPVPLRSCNTYREQLLKTEALELKLPPCTTVSLYEGESTREDFSNCINRTLLKSLCTVTRSFIADQAVNMSVIFYTETLLCGY